MKLLKKLASCLVLFSTLQSCVPLERKDNNSEILRGKHELRRLKVSSNEKSEWSAGYFLFAGSASGKTYKETKVSFSWKMNTGEYAISEIEVGNIRVRIDSTVIKPYVTFNWDKSRVRDLHFIFDYDINYMTIVCREEDYPINVNIDQL